MAQITIQNKPPAGSASDGTAVDRHARRLAEIIMEAIEAIFRKLFGRVQPQQQQPVSQRSNTVRKPAAQKQTRAQAYGRSVDLMAAWAESKLKSDPADEVGMEMQKQAAEFRKDGYSQENFERLQNYMTEKAEQDAQKCGAEDKKSQLLTQVVSGNAPVNDLAAEMAKEQGLASKQGQANSEKSSSPKLSPR